MPVVLSDVLNASAAADNKLAASGTYMLDSFTRLGGLLQSSDGNLSLNLCFRRDGENRILLSGNIGGQITMQCQRCLGPVLLQLDLPLELVLAERDNNGGGTIAGPANESRGLDARLEDGSHERHRTEKPIFARRCGNRLSPLSRTVPIVAVGRPSGYSDARTRGSYVKRRM